MHSVLWLFVGDSFSGPCTKCNNGMPFSTYDRENDNAPNDMYYGHCAQWAKGGWWFNACHRSNLNGWYGDSSYAQGITWEAWKGFYDSLKSSTMKIRKLWKESSDLIVDFFFKEKWLNFLCCNRHCRFLIDHCIVVLDLYSISNNIYFKFSVVVGFSNTLC